MGPISDRPSGEAIRFAKIVKAHPSSNSHDVVMLDDGSRFPGVQSIATHASNNAGTINMHRPDQDEADDWSPKMASDEDQTKRDVIAVVAMVGVTPVIIGHIYPPVSQLNFPDTDEFKNLQLDRHASDLVQSTDDAANYNIKHPSASYISMSQTGAPPDFTGKDYDKVWKITRNTASQAMIVINTEKARITIIPSGTITEFAENQITITAQRFNVDIYAGSDITLTAGRDINETAGQHIQLTAPRIDLN